MGEYERNPPGSSNSIEGNTRRSRCVAFCSRPPATAQKLALHVVSDPPIQLGEWSRNEWTPVLGEELFALMSEHHEEAEVSESKFSAAYLDADGRAIRTKTFAQRTTRQISAGDAAALAAAMDGSDRASTQLAQQTALAMVRMYLTAQQAQTQAFVQMTTLLSEKLVDSEERSEAARENYHEVREALVEMRQLAQAGAETPAELSPAQAKFFELANLALPGIIAKLSSR